VEGNLHGSPYRAFLHWHTDRHPRHLILHTIDGSTKVGSQKVFNPLVDKFDSQSVFSLLLFIESAGVIFDFNNSEDVLSVGTDLYDTLAQHLGNSMFNCVLDQWLQSKCWNSHLEERGVDHHLHG
jgi:hypothetical protein